MEPKKVTRRFRVGAGRTVVFPVALDEGTHNTRLDPGSIVDLDVARIRKHQRYVNNLIRWGDLVEVTAPTSSSPAAPVKE